VTSSGHRRSEADRPCDRPHGERVSAEELVVEDSGALEEQRADGVAVRASRRPVGADSSMVVLRFEADASCPASTSTLNR
jgi:hypothetical protein